MGAGCEKDVTTLKTGKGEWTLIGFGDDSTGEFTSEPESEPKSSYVIINKGEMVAYSVTNRTYDISYEVKRERINVTNKGGRTKVGGDTEWGLKFLMAINDIYKFNINSELILYYEDQKFMKLKKETK
jgi:hypothetical protein